MVTQPPICSKPSSNDPGVSLRSLGTSAFSALPRRFERRERRDTRRAAEILALLTFRKRECPDYALVTILYPHSSRRPGRCRGYFAQTSVARRSHPAIIGWNLFFVAAGPKSRDQGHADFA